MKIIIFFIRSFSKVLLRIQCSYYKGVIKKCGSDFKVWGIISIKNPSNLSVGNSVSINDFAYLNAKGGIFIGNNVSISAGAKIISTKLDTSKISTDKVHIDKAIHIGSNVQIGSGAIILPGVTIGNNVIVGAGTIVSKDIQNNKVIYDKINLIMRDSNE
ncbi:acyltransferase [Vibrio splendidus]|uniref:acyltransferase n=1 Tax=Vibrio splendidus TaxID=29497 RepID=UPI0011B3F90E|nr:acyltransferase [Vibrio splendidus]